MKTITFHFTDEEETQLVAMFADTHYDMLVFPTDSVAHLWERLSVDKAPQFESHHCSLTALPTRLSVHRLYALNPETLDIITKYRMEARFDE